MIYLIKILINTLFVEIAPWSIVSELFGLVYKTDVAKRLYAAATADDCKSYDFHFNVRGFFFNFSGHENDKTM